MNGPDITLYHFPACPYCARVRRAVDQLGLEIEYRDIQRDPAALDALVGARGRPTVPVLHIRDEPTPRWLGESAEIVRYLYARFADGKAPPLHLRVNPKLWVVVGVIVVLLVVRWLA